MRPLRRAVVRASLSRYVTLSCGHPDGGTIPVARIRIDPRANPVAQHADLFDFQLDDVARLEIAGGVASSDGFADAAASDGATAKDIARHDTAVARRALDKVAPAVLHVPCIAVHPRVAINAQTAVEVESTVAQVWCELIAGH